MSPISAARRARLAIVVVLVACAFGAMFRALPASAADMDESAKALAKLDDAWSAAAATRDADKVAAFYADDCLAYPPGEPLATGKAAAKKVWAAYFANPSFKISWKSTHAEVSGTLGFTSGPYEATFKGPDGKPGVEKGKFLCVWKKQADGSWKAAHDMWNADGR